MKTHEELIAFYRNYCQHYKRGKGADMVCAAGMNRANIQKVPSGDRGIKWGPCIEGHTLANPTGHCPKWIRRTQEEGEKYANEVEMSIKQMETVAPLVAKWRTWTESNRVDKQEVVECPVCKCKLALSQSAHNGHVWCVCETSGCVNWME